MYKIRCTGDFVRGGGGELTKLYLFGVKLLYVITFYKQLAWSLNNRDLQVSTTKHATHNLLTVLPQCRFRFYTYIYK